MVMLPDELPIARAPRRLIACLNAALDAIELARLPLLVLIGLSDSDAQRQHLALRVVEPIALPPHDFERVTEFRLHPVQMPDVHAIGRAGVWIVCHRRSDIFVYSAAS